MSYPNTLEGTPRNSARRDRDITHLSKPAEFHLTEQHLSRLRTTEMHTVPGEHDTTDPTVTESFNRLGKASGNKGRPWGWGTSDGPQLIGLASVAVVKHPHALWLNDATIA